MATVDDVNTIFLLIYETKRNGERLILSVQFVSEYLVHFNAIKH